MTFVSLVLVLALAAGDPAAAQSPTTPPPPAPAAPAPAQTRTDRRPDAGATAGRSRPREFTSDAGLMFSVIKPDKTADFEAVMARVKEALAKSDDPKRKQQALPGWSSRGSSRVWAATVIYVWLIDPPVKDIEYHHRHPARGVSNEAQDLWARYMRASSAARRC